MPSHSDGYRFFLNEFDESIDALMLDLISVIQDNMTTQIDIWINSEGGDAYRAFALVELISLAKQRDITVRTFVLSEAFSAGSLVAVAGSPGYRFVAPTAAYMLHYGEAEQTATDPVSAGRIGKANVAHFKKVLQHYEDHCNIPRLKNKLEHDFLYIAAEHGITWGLADDYINSQYI